MNNVLEVNKNINVLLKKITEVLSILPIDEVIEAISNILLNKEKHANNLEMATNIVCVEFNVSQKTFFEKYSRNEIYQAKITLFVLLNKHLGISKRKIAQKFRTYPNSVNVAISHFEKLMPDKFKRDKEFLDKYKVCLSKLLEKISHE